MDGEELRRRRKQLGMTQVELANRLGVYQATINQWERGVRGIRHGVILGLALDMLEHDMRHRDRVREIGRQIVAEHAAALERLADDD